MKSIMHNKKDHTCYLCMNLHGDDSWKDPLQEHHVMYGKGRRKLSERYGLKIYLCNKHHTYDQGSEAVHRKDAVRRYTEKAAQEAFEKKYPELSFRKIFETDYTEEDYTEEASGQQAYENLSGIIFLK